MSKKIAVQSAKNKIKSAEVAPPSVAVDSMVTAETVSKVATKQAAAKPAAVAKKAVATPKTPAKPLKNVPAASMEDTSPAPKVETAEKASKDKRQAPKKPKLVRDSFTIPDTDYALFASLKQRALTAGVDVKKGEILRAAVATLAALDDAELVKAIGLVERIKTGRPKK